MPLSFALLRGRALAPGLPQPGLPRQPPALPWPDLAQMRGATHTRRSNIARQIKLGWALLRAQAHRGQFDAVLQQHRHWQPVFLRQASSFEPLLQSFMDRRAGMAQRFLQVQHDLAAATQAFGVATGSRIALGERVVLCTLGHVNGVGSAGSIGLGLNPVCKREGLWALSLHNACGLRVCQISFSFLPGQRLMIGSVQGAAAQDSAAMQAVRDLTHAAEGLRPAHLLSEVLRALCRRWSLDLVGVDPQHHVKKRWHQRTLAVCFDYCGFWTELGGQRQADAVWSLPTVRAARDIADVPSKRRAQYKRRLALLAALPEALQHLPFTSTLAPAATVTATLAATLTPKPRPAP